jgi:ABC-type transport system substrate-binding protein
MDALLEKGLTISDQTEREKVYQAVLDLWARDLPLVPLVSGDQITVMDKRVQGYVLAPSGNHFFGPVYWNSQASGE